jgi:hypothetical protein
VTIRETPHRLEEILGRFDLRDVPGLREQRKLGARNGGSVGAARLFSR